MEEDLRAQAEFLSSGKAPSATVVREKSIPSHSATSSNSKSAPFSMFSPVGVIKERERTAVNTTNDTSVINTGFPKAETVFSRHRAGKQLKTGRKSIFKQAMEAKAEKKVEQLLESTPLSDQEKAAAERSISKEVSRDEIKQGVNSILGQMSEQEILDAQNELMHSLDPSLISFLMKRSQYKEECQISSTNPSSSSAALSGTHGHDSIQPISSFPTTTSQSTLFPPEPMSDEVYARNVANSIDYSKIKTEDDLAAAVSKLPDSEKLKLAWTRPILSSDKQSNKPRFHFDGTLLDPSSNEMHPLSSGLYNHGEDASRPGYTIEELCILSRSAVTGQRVLALKCLFNVLHCRSLARLYGQTLTPSTLPVAVVKVLVMLLERRYGAEEVFLAIRCLEELCTSSSELQRRLELNLSYHGYEYAHLQDSSALEFLPDDHDDEHDDEHDGRNDGKRAQDTSNPYRQTNCTNLFTMLLEAGIVDLIFSLLTRFAAIPTVLQPALSLLRVLIESDSRFGLAIVRSGPLFDQLEGLCKIHLDLSILPSTPLSPPPPPPVSSSISSSSSSSSSVSFLSLRHFYLDQHPQTPIAAALQVLLVIESLVRQSRSNALNIVRSSILPILKQWLLFFDEDHPSAADQPEVNAVVEGVLSVWRLCLLYGLDGESVDAFLPVLVRLSQFAWPCCRVLAWSFFEITVVNKQTTSSRYFVDFCNTLVMLAVELLREKSMPLPVLTAVAHFLGSYVDIVNDCRERWEAISTEPSSFQSPSDNTNEANEMEKEMESLQHQVMELGYAVLQHAQTLIPRTWELHHHLCQTWTTLLNQSSPRIRNEDPSPSAFRPEEMSFLLQTDALLAVTRVAFSGIQNSLAFAEMLKQSGWLEQFQELAVRDVCGQVQSCPHSFSYTYLHRCLILAQVHASLLLHTVLPLPSLSLSPTVTSMSFTNSPHAQVWRSAWTLVQSILPGDEYTALQLILHVLLHPVSLRRYLEGTAADAPLHFDLDLLTDLLIQQLGDGRTVEHSQRLTLPAYAERTSLQLLLRLHRPALPLLPHWVFLPLLKLRFRPVGEPVDASPVVAATEGQVVALLQFVKEMETSELVPWEAGSKAMRLYGILHLLCASSEVVRSPAVTDLVHTLLPLYGLKISVDNSEDVDCLSELEDLVPQEEMMALLQKSSTFVLDEFYECPLVFELLLLFLRPDRCWNYRVLLLNFFFDNDLCLKILSADSLQICSKELENKVSASGLNTCLAHFYHQYLQSYTGPWEEKEEVMEMFIRYFEKCQAFFRNGYHAVAINRFMFHLLHYIDSKGPRFAFFAREIERVYPSITVRDLCSVFSYLCFV